MAANRLSTGPRLVLTVAVLLTALVATGTAAAQDQPRPDTRVETPGAPPPGTVSTGPGATHLLHVDVEAHLYDEDFDLFVSFDPGPDEMCELRADLWIEMSARDGRMELAAIEPPPPGTLRNPQAFRGPFVDPSGRRVSFTCAGEISVCWWDSTIEVLPDGRAELNLEVLLFEADTFLGPYRPCAPGDLEDRTTLTITAAPDRLAYCSRGPIDTVYTPTVGKVGSDGAAVRACLSNHPLTELESFWASLMSGTTGAVGSLAVAVDAQAEAYGGIDGYRWSWGDGSTTEVPYAGLVHHTYTRPGVYWIEVTALPTRAVTSPATLQVARIVVQAPPGAPTAVIDAPAAAQPGETVTLDASASRPGTGREGDIAEYRWDFGDGTQVTLNAFDDQSWDHTYEQAGSYTVTLVASAMNTLEHSATHVITVG